MNPSDLARHDRERDERRTELIGNMEVRFGPGWRNRDWENPQQDLSSEWWVLQPRLHLDGTARLVSLTLVSIYPLDELIDFPDSTGGPSRPSAFHPTPSH